MKKPGLITFRDAFQKRTDLMGSGLNLFTSLLHSHIFGFSGQKRGSPDHNSKLIVDGMKNLLRKGHSNPRQRK